ncbi:MAG: ATP-binding protein [Lachnospiraceae bacterium]|nr:ATP-binding protein [Lachnospiraceae bacterium]
MADVQEFLIKTDEQYNLSDVILSDENREKIDLFLNEIAHRKEFKKYGLNPLNRLLFYGASGTGKTMLATALAKELNYTMLAVDIAKALSDNSVAKNITEVFDYANSKKNCLIFLDECDSITMSRYNASYDDTAQVRRATNSLFQYLDRMDIENMFIAATNLLYKIDPAFERRMNLKLEFKRPQVDILDTIKKFLHKDFELINDVDKNVYTLVIDRSKANTKLSYYEIKGIVERAMKDAIINGTLEVRTSRIFKDLAETMNLKFRFHTDTDPIEMYKRPVDDMND